jgi:hypothetical protein
MALAPLLLIAAEPALGQAARPRDPAQSRCVLRIRGMDRAVVRADLPFRASRDTTLHFDLILPPGRPAGALPMVFFYNAAGGWDPPLRRWGIYRDWGKLLSTRRIASVFYDGAPERTGEDAESLLVHLRRDAVRLGLDRERMALWGCSMHVWDGLRFAMNPAHGFKAAVLYYGVTDTAAMNPDVPVLLARAGLDAPQINHAMGAWAAKAARQGAPLTWLDLPTLHHAFDAFEDDTLSRQVVRLTLDFLQHELSREGIASRMRNADERRVRRLSAEGRWQETAQLAERWVAQEPENPDAHRFLADARYQLQAFAEAATHYEKAGDLGQQPGVTWYNAACCLARIGEKERALALLEKAFATRHAPDRAAAARDPDLASLAGEPRFQSLIRP